jgi:hypothetical protein
MNMIMRFPHVKFISPIVQREKDLYYLGETNNKFTRGKLYKVRDALYSEDENTPRIKVLITNTDTGGIMIVTEMEFGNLSELRDVKIKEVLDNE